MALHAAQTRSRLLMCGLVAGPFFLLTSVILALTREGFDITKHPLSFLGVSDWGWLQMANFIIAGLLVLALAVGVRRSLKDQKGRIVGPLLLGGLGVGLLLAGAFPPDPGFGFPLGTPEGDPENLTYRSALHGLGFMLSFICFALAGVVFIRRDVRKKYWGRAAVGVVAIIGALGLSVLWPGTDGIALRNLGSAIFLWTWVSLQAYWLLAGTKA